MVFEKLENIKIGIVEVISIVSSFLLITGVFYYYGYYDAGLNAGWVIKSINTKELLLANIRLGACVLLALGFMESLITPHPVVKPISVFYTANFVFVVMIIMVVFSKNVAGVLELFTYLLTFNALYFLIFLRVIWKLLAISLLFVVIPFLNGILAYHKKIESELPIVVLNDDKKKWLLFDTLSDQALLIDAADKHKNIRIVPLSELPNVEVR